MPGWKSQRLLVPTRSGILTLRRSEGPVNPELDKATYSKDQMKGVAFLFKPGRALGVVASTQNVQSKLIGSLPSSGGIGIAPETKSER